MMVRRTWSSCSEEVSALPSSWKTVTSLLSGTFAGAPEAWRRSTPSKGTGGVLRTCRSAAPGFASLVSGVNVVIIVNDFCALQRCFADRLPKGQYRKLGNPGCWRAGGRWLILLDIH